MDKVNQLKEALRKYLENWVEYHPDEQTGIPLSIIESESDGHFFLLEFGLGEKGWVHFLMAHLQVSDQGKIILLHNSTDIEILKELKEYEVKDEDMIVGWNPHPKKEQEQKQAA